MMSTQERCAQLYPLVAKMKWVFGSEEKRQCLLMTLRQVGCGSCTYGFEECLIRVLCYLGILLLESGTMEDGHCLSDGCRWCSSCRELKRHEKVYFGHDTLSTVIDYLISYRILNDDDFAVLAGWIAAEPDRWYSDPTCCEPMDVVFPKPASCPMKYIDRREPSNLYRNQVLDLVSSLFSQAVALTKFKSELDQGRNLVHQLVYVPRPISDQTGLALELADIRMRLRQLPKTEKHHDDAAERPRKIQHRIELPYLDELQEAVHLRDHCLSYVERTPTLWEKYRLMFE